MTEADFRVIDSLRADHPDPSVERTLVLLDGPPDDPLDVPLVEGHPAEATADLDLVEAWDGVFHPHLERDENAGDRLTIGFSVSEPMRLATLFHASATWLGLVKSPVRSVHLHVAENADAEALAAAFAREKVRHLRVHEIDLPEVDWLAAEHQYAPMAEAAWDYASTAERPDGLSVRQLFAIRLYTSEFYLAFHNALRPGRGDHPVYRAVLPILACLDAGLENLPPVTDTTFRGERWDSETAESRRRLDAGSEFQELSYLSSSRNELHAAALRRGFLFRVRGQSGREISAFSEFPWEQEVLFGRGLVQRVLSKDCSDRSIGEECDFETEEAGRRRGPATSDRLRSE